MNDLISIFDKVKSDLCNLISYKVRGNTLEIITSVTTLNQTVVSVFLSIQDGQYVVSDGGWIDVDEYEVEEYTKEEIAEEIDEYLLDYFKIKTVNSAVGVRYYYRISPDINLVSAMVYDVSNFIGHYINSKLLIIKHSIELKKRKPQFKSRINKFLKARFAPSEISINERVTIDDNHRIRFNSVIRTANQLINPVVMMYITGNQSDSYNDSISRATANFDIVKKYAKKDSNFDMIAVMNLDSPGYNSNKSFMYIKNLTETIGKEPIRIQDTDNLSELSNALPKSGILLQLGDN